MVAGAVILAGTGKTTVALTQPSTMGAPPVSAASLAGGPATTVTSTSPADGLTTTEATRSAAPPASPPTTVASPAVISKVVVVDPGHQAGSYSGVEPIGPGSSTMKEKTTSGTEGAVTHISEAELNLVVGLKLRDALQNRGIQVDMTRTSLTQGDNVGNIDRAQFWNAKHAALVIRVHADGVTDGSVHGIHVLYPAAASRWTDAISAPSRRAAQLAEAALVAATGAKELGIDPHTDMTGLNWSKVPVILPEIGFMSNPSEDRLLATDAYRQKIADACSSTSGSWCFCLLPASSSLQQSLAARLNSPALTSRRAEAEGWAVHLWPLVLSHSCKTTHSGEVTSSTASTTPTSTSVPTPQPHGASGASGSWLVAASGKGGLPQREPKLHLTPAVLEAHDLELVDVRDDGGQTQASRILNAAGLNGHSEVARAHHADHEASALHARTDL